MKLIEFLMRLSTRTNELIKKLANGSLFLCASVSVCVRVCVTSAWTLKVIYFLALTWERLSHRQMSLFCCYQLPIGTHSPLSARRQRRTHVIGAVFSQQLLTNCEQLTSCLQIQINHIFRVGAQCGGLERSMLCSLTRANKENSSSFFFFPLNILGYERRTKAVSNASNYRKHKHTHTEGERNQIQHFSI